MLYLVMNKYGYYLGTSKEEVRNSFYKLHSKDLRIIDCYSAPDAKNIIKKYCQTMNPVVIPDKLTVGEAVPWIKTLRAMLLMGIHTRLRFYYNGKVEVTFSDGTIGEYANDYKSASHPNETACRLISEFGKVVFYSEAEDMYVYYYPDGKPEPKRPQARPVVTLAHGVMIDGVFHKIYEEKRSSNESQDANTIAPRCKYYGKRVGSSEEIKLSKKPELSASI